MSRTIEESKEELQTLETRLKTLVKNREKIVGRIAVEEQNRKNALEKLVTEYPDIASMDSDALKELQISLEEEVSNSIDTLEELLGNAEKLMEKVRDI